MAVPSPSGAAWHGAHFAVRVDYFAGQGRPVGGGGTGSVPANVGRYKQRAMAVKTAVHRHFDGMVPIDMVGVDVPYALEVLVVPRGQGKTQAVLVFSKLEARDWPRIQDVLLGLRRFCQLPASFRVLRPAAEGTDGGTEGTPLTGVTLRVEHAASKTSVEVETDAAGVAETVLFPGLFKLCLCGASAFAGLEPGTATLPAVFELHEETCVALPRHAVTLTLMDHLEQPLANFAMHLTRQRGSSLWGHFAEEPRTLLTDAAGMCQLLLDEGSYLVRDDPDAAVSVLETFEQQLRVTPGAPEASRTISIVARRTIFPVEVFLHTAGGVPVPGCRFTVSSFSAATVEGVTSAAGIAAAQITEGHHELRFLPAAGSTLSEVTVALVVRDDGATTPDRVEIRSRIAEVNVFFITPDGEPAENCQCVLLPSGGRGPLPEGEAVRLDSGNVGVATARLPFFEQYALEVCKDNEEYEAHVQPVCVQSTTCTVTVQRRLFCRVAECSFAIVVDATSSAVRGRLAEVATAVRDALERRASRGQAHVSIFAYAEEVQRWRSEPVIVSSQVAQEAAAFCLALQPGMGPEPYAALEVALKQPDLDAVYFLAGGDSEVDDPFVKRVQVAFYRHPRRPRLHAVLLGAAPEKAAWKHMQALALLSKASFRPVSFLPPAGGDG